MKHQAVSSYYFGCLLIFSLCFVDGILGSPYACRDVEEGIFRALTVGFGDRVKARRESTETRMLLKTTVYCLKIIVMEP